VGDVLFKTISGTYTLAMNYHNLCDKWANLAERIKGYKSTVIQSVGQKIVSQTGIITEEELEDRIYTLSLDERGLLRAIHRDASEILDIKDSLFDDYKLQDKDIKSKLEDFGSIFVSQMQNWDSDEEQPYKLNVKELMYKEIKIAVESQKNLADVIEMDKWTDGINIEDAVRRKDNSVLNIKSLLKQAVLEATGIAEYSKLNDERSWTEREKGAILFSDDKRNFFKISADGNLKKAHPKDYDKIIVDTINSIED
jgi:hypothetical protein